MVANNRAILDPMCNGLVNRENPKMSKEYVDDRYCGNCGEVTEHIIRDSEHERDSSQDWRRCHECKWEYNGYTGKYHAPDPIEPPPGEAAVTIINTGNPHYSGTILDYRLTEGPLSREEQDRIWDEGVKRSISIEPGSHTQESIEIKDCVFLPSDDLELKVEFPPGYTSIDVNDRVVTYRYPPLEEPDN